MNDLLTRRDFLKASGGALMSISLVGIAGCGGGEQQDGEGASFSFLAAQYSNATPDYWKDLVSEFRKENPDIKVDLEIIGWDQLLRQVNTKVTTGQAPNLLNLNSYASYAADDLLLPSEDVISSELKDNFYPNFYDASKVEDTAYGIPFIASIRNLYYNQEIFDKVGIKEPPKTWDELLQTAQAIQEEVGITGFGVPMTEFEGQAYFSYFIWGNGGDWQRDGQWVFNSPENVEGLQFLVDLINKHKVTNPDPTSINRDELQKVFGAGEIGMMITANFFPTILKEEAPDLDWALGPIPVNEGVSEFSLGVEDFLMVFNNTENPEAVGKFLDFFFQGKNGENYEKFLNQEGMLPVLEPVGETMSGKDELTAQFIEQIPKAKFYPLSEPKFDVIRVDVVKACQKAITGEMSSKAALDELQQKVTG